MAIQSINPATGETLRRFRALTAQEIETKLDKAWRARTTWARTPVANRARIVGRAGEILDERKREFGELMTLEMGKTLRSAVEEAAKCATGCRYYAQHAEAFVRDELVDIEGETGYVAFQP